MQMIWKYDSRRNLEWVSRPRVPERSSQQIDVFRQ
jgi:hypothetical protein